MSLQTWKAEFYPEDAKETPRDRAVAMSLRKWEGLRPEVLAQHKVTHPTYGAYISRDLIDDIDEGLPFVERRREAFTIDSDTCALCTYYINDGDECADCPLSRIRGGIRCDRLRQDEAMTPFAKYRREGDPEPMIAWLKKALQLEAKTRERRHP